MRVFLDQIDANNPGMKQGHEWLPITSYLLIIVISSQIEMQEYNSYGFLIQVSHLSISHKG